MLFSLKVKCFVLLDIHSFIQVYLCVSAQVQSLDRNRPCTYIEVSSCGSSSPGILSAIMNGLSFSEQLIRVYKPQQNLG